jgi:hypothetical protein
MTVISAVRMALDGAGEDAAVGATAAPGAGHMNPE